MVKSVRNTSARKSAANNHDRMVGDRKEVPLYVVECLESESQKKITLRLACFTIKCHANLVAPLFGIVSSASTSVSKLTTLST